MRSAILTCMTLLLAVSACGGSGKAPHQAPAPDATTVRVENRNWLDMTIYVVRGGQRIRLGVVTGNSTRVLKIPRGIVFGTTPLRFLADPVGARRTPISQEIQVREGDQVTLTIPPT